MKYLSTFTSYFNGVQYFSVKLWDLRRKPTFIQFKNSVSDYENCELRSEISILKPNFEKWKITVLRTHLTVWNRIVEKKICYLNFDGKYFDFEGRELISKIRESTVSRSSSYDRMKSDVRKKILFWLQKYCSGTRKFRTSK